MYVYIYVCVYYVYVYIYIAGKAELQRSRYRSNAILIFPLLIHSFKQLYQPGLGPLQQAPRSSIQVSHMCARAQARGLSFTAFLAHQQEVGLEVQNNQVSDLHSNIGCQHCKQAQIIVPQQQFLLILVWIQKYLDFFVLSDEVIDWNAILKEA